MAFQNFIVLGIIPGTNIQISFEVWLCLMVTSIAVWQYRSLMHSKLLAALLLRYTFSKQKSLDLITL